MVGIPDVITCANFGEDRLRGLGLAGGQSLTFSIDFDCRHYNTFALPCECVIVMESISREFRVALQCEPLYADDLVVIAEAEEDLIKRLNEWKDNVENKDMRVNMNKTKVTRHTASTSMYSLTFRVRVATRAQYGRNGMASLQITTHTQQARRFYRCSACVHSACGVRWAWRITAGLCHAFP